MNKKTFAIIVELLPIISAPLSYLLIVSGMDSELIRGIIGFTTCIAFLGFVFFFIGRKLAKEEKIVKILGIFDWLATASVIGFYVIILLNLAG